MGFPSNGLVGTFSMSYIISYLQMQQVGEIEHPDITPALFIEDGEIYTPIRIYKKANIFAIISEIPFDTDVAYEFAEIVTKIAKKHSIDKIVILSGMESVNRDPKKPKTFGLITHKSLEEYLYQNDIPKFLAGTILGTDAAIISTLRKSDVPCLVLYTECHPTFPDPNASIYSISTVSRILKTKIDTKDLEKRIDQIRIQNRDLMQETMNIIQGQQSEKRLPVPAIYR